MGWASETYVMQDIIRILKDRILKDRILKDRIPDEDLRKEIYGEIVESLVYQDWDCVEEPVGMDDAYDRWYYEKYDDGEEVE